MVTVTSDQKHKILRYFTMRYQAVWIRVWSVSQTQLLSKSNFNPYDRAFSGFDNRSKWEICSNLAPICSVLVKHKGYLWKKSEAKILWYLSANI